MATMKKLHMLSSKGGYQETWKMCFNPISTHFSSWLSMTADPQERRLTGTVISTLESSKQPDEDALAVIQRRSPRVSKCRIISSPELRELGPCFNRLLPILQLERSPYLLFSGCCSDTAPRLARECLHRRRRREMLLWVAVLSYHYR